MKTTLDINDTLLAHARTVAGQQSTSLTRLIEEGLRLGLRRPRVTSKVGEGKTPVFKGCGGLVAGVYPRRNKAMLDPADDDA